MRSSSLRSLSISSGSSQTKFESLSDTAGLPVIFSAGWDIGISQLLSRSIPAAHARCGEAFSLPKNRPSRNSFLPEPERFARTAEKAPRQYSVQHRSGYNQLRLGHVGRICVGVKHRFGPRTDVINRRRQLVNDAGADLAAF